jgi:hypothetical protein
MERTARKETFPSYIGVIVHATFSSSGTVGSKQFGVAKQVSLIRAFHGSPTLAQLSFRLESQLEVS